MCALRCFKTTTTASPIVLAKPASASSYLCVCVCSSRCKLEKAIPAGCLKTAGSGDFHSRRHLSLPLRLTCSLLLCDPHRHTHTLLRLCAHTCSFLRLPFLIYFFFPLLSLTQPSTIPLPHFQCVRARVYLAGVMTRISSVGSYQDLQSHGCDASLCVSSNLFVV